MPLTTKFTKYLIVGGLNTLISLVCITVFTYISLDKTVATFLGYIAGLTFGYFFNRTFTFQSKNGGYITIIRYITAFLFSYLLAHAAATLTQYTFHNSSELLFLTTHIMIYTITSFFIFRRFVFNSN